MQPLFALGKLILGLIEGALSLQHVEKIGQTRLKETVGHHHRPFTGVDRLAEDAQGLLLLGKGDQTVFDFGKGGKYCLFVLRQGRIPASLADFDAGANLTLIEKRQSKHRTDGPVAAAAGDEVGQTAALQPE